MAVYWMLVGLENRKNIFWDDIKNLAEKNLVFQVQLLKQHSAQNH